MTAQQLVDAFTELLQPNQRLRSLPLLAKIIDLINFAAAQTGNDLSQYVNKTTDKASASDLTAGTVGKFPDAKEVKDYVLARISALIDNSPALLDTLDELAAALGDDPNFSTTILTLLGLKANDADVVKLTGNQSIAGAKTFASRIQFNSSIISRNNNLDTGKYVNFNMRNDDEVNNYTVSFSIDEEGNFLLILTNVTTFIDYQYTFPLQSLLIGGAQIDTTETALVSSTAIALDMADYMEKSATLALAHNAAFSVVNPGQNKVYLISLTTDASTRTITLPANSIWCGNVATLSLAASSKFNIAVRARNVSGTWNYEWVIIKFN
jgi:hypothetical protein